MEKERGGPVIEIEIGSRSSDEGGHGDQGPGYGKMKRRGDQGPGRMEDVLWCRDQGPGDNKDKHGNQGPGREKEHGDQGPGHGRQKVSMLESFEED